ncbi:orexigenic neuropeptide QRFP isoform X2 [Cynocephalus volans]
MMSPSSLSYLLLLPLGACFPLLDRRELADAMGGIRAGMSRAGLAEGHPPHFVWSSSGWPRVPQPQALLFMAKELQTSGREHAGFRFRFGRQDSSEVTSLLPDDSEKASGGALGNLAEELSGYSRKKGGFSFRFGRR